jgi:hypothetical protein
LTRVSQIRQHLVGFFFSAKICFEQFLGKLRADRLAPGERGMRQSSRRSERFRGNAHISRGHSTSWISAQIAECVPAPVQSPLGAKIWRVCLI